MPLDSIGATESAEIEIPSGLPPHARTGSSRDAARFVREEGVNLAVWPRRLPQALEDDIRRLSASEAFRLAVAGLTNPVESVRVSARSPNVNKLRRAFEKNCAGSGFFAEEAVLLVEHYRNAFPGVPEVDVQLRLEKSGPGENGPEPFHYDGKASTDRWRLISTYDGPTTEWLANGDGVTCVRRGDLPHTASSLKVVPEGSVLIRRFARGHVALLKDGASGLFHRRGQARPRRPRMTLVILPSPA